MVTFRGQGVVFRKYEWFHRIQEVKMYRVRGMNYKFSNIDFSEIFSDIKKQIHLPDSYKALGKVNSKINDFYKKEKGHDDKDYQK